MENMSKTLRPFATHEGTATRKIKTVSKDAPPARNNSVSRIEVVQMRNDS